MAAEVKTTVFQTVIETQTPVKDGGQLVEKVRFLFCASCDSTHKIEFAQQIHKNRGVVQTTLSCRYAAIHLVYLGFYTREEKMCPEDAVFLQHSIESVVSIERLLEKR